MFHETDRLGQFKKRITMEHIPIFFFYCPDAFCNIIFTVGKSDQNVSQPLFQRFDVQLWVITGAQKLQ